MRKLHRVLAALLAIQLLLPALALAITTSAVGDRTPSCCQGKHGACCRMKAHSVVALSSTSRCGSQCGCDGVAAQDLKLLGPPSAATEPVPHRSLLVLSRAIEHPARTIDFSVRPRSPPA